MGEPGLLYASVYVFCTTIMFSPSASDTSVCDIVQLSATCGTQSFNAYILPSGAITAGATRVTGFTVSDGSLFLRGQRVNTIPAAEALTNFITFLRSFPFPVILAAHNANCFDVPVLSRVLQQYSLFQDFQQVVSGFLDTLLLARRLFPQLGSYSQGYLVNIFLRKSHQAHNAAEDARMLQELYFTWTPTRWEVMNAMI